MLQYTCRDAPDVLQYFDLVGGSLDKMKHSLHKHY